jgi:MFS family permease
MSSSAVAIDTRRGLIAQLSLMMFLEYAARGIWYPYLANYLQATPAHGGLGFTGAQVGWILGLAASVGAFTSPFIAGQVADRYLNAEKALGILIFVSGVAQLLLSHVRTFPEFLGLSLLQSLAYIPTLALTNGLSFTHLPDPEHSFPRIRMWGTISWLVSSTLFPLIFLSTSNDVINVARISWSLAASGLICLALTIQSFTTLPKTPPKRETQSLAFSRAFRAFRQRRLFVLLVILLPTAMMHHAFYFRVGPFYQQVFAKAGIPLRWVGPAIALGQCSEIIAMMVLGSMLKRFGYRAVFTIAALAFIVRFGCFATGAPVGLVIFGGSLHGFCLGFLITAGCVYVEMNSPPDIRHSTQTVYNFMYLGVAPILASIYNSFFDRYVRGGVQDYRAFWSTQTAVAIACLMAIWALFPRHTKEKREHLVIVEEPE